MFSDGFQGNKSWLIRLILLNIRSAIWSAILNSFELDGNMERNKGLSSWITRNNSQKEQSNTWNYITTYFAMLFIKMHLLKGVVSARINEVKFNHN